MEDMQAIYEITDELGIDRESINVELGKEDPGSWKFGSGGLLSKNVIEITVPLTQDIQEWLGSLRDGLKELISGSN